MPSRRDWILFEALIFFVRAGAFPAGLGSSAYHTRQQAEAQAETSATAFQPFWQVWGYLHDEYDGPLPDDRTLTYAAIRGVLQATGDPYTVLVEPQPHQAETESLQGHYGGIGAALSRDEQGQVRVSPFRDGPAAQAGVQLDDVLLAIGGAPVTISDTIETLDRQLRGEEGTTVTLTLARTDGAGLGARFDLAVARADIPIPSVTSRILREDASIGYIGVSRFSATTGDEVRDATLALRSQGAQCLVLDLRDDGGGLLDGAVKVSSQFLASGVVLYETTRENTTFFPVEQGGVATDIPLVVLVNGGTASAAEVVAGALQDTGRAQLIGTRTYGKGSVQYVHDLRDGSSVHITTARWLTPHRRSIDGTGLEPDIAVDISAEDRAAGRDTQLLRAIESLQGR